MPRDVAFLEELFSDRSRVHAEFTVDGRHVTAVLVQLEAFHEGRWKPVRRYDDAHRWPHLDVLNTKSDSIQKIWLELSRSETVTAALSDFRTNWRTYLAELEGR